MSPAPGTRVDHPRRAALEALTRVEEDNAYSTHVVATAVDGLADARDRRFASHLAYDTLRWRGSLDWLLGQVLSRPLADVEAPLQRVLRLGALQLWRMRVPDRAAVSTSVELARTVVPGRRADGAARFVNGVLRNLARRLDQVPWPDPNDEPVRSLSLRTGHPEWVVTELLDHMDGDATAALLAADNEPPGLTVRATGDRDALVAELRALGLDASATELTDVAVRVPGGDPRRLDAVADGRAVPQDEASMLVSLATGAEPGDRVVDLCAGPGGKTSHLAELVGPSGRVVAVELHPHRARRVSELASRLGHDVDVKVGDATVLALDVGEVDRVLVDAPCSGLGVGRRRPEVRWRRQPEDPAAMATLQLELARRAIDLVRPGGHVTYAVCTWTQVETEAVAQQVEATTSRRIDRVSTRQYLPSTDGTDGMYVVTWHVAG